MEQGIKYGEQVVRWLAHTVGFSIGFLLPFIGIAIALIAIMLAVGMVVLFIVEMLKPAPTKSKKGTKCRPVEE